MGSWSRSRANTFSSRIDGGICYPEEKEIGHFRILKFLEDEKKETLGREEK